MDEESALASHVESGIRGNRVIAQRTRLYPGAAERYCEVHARIPEAIAVALREAGVVDWRIWRDGDVLFHTIETTHGLDGMRARMAARGPIDPEWDALIATLVDQSDDASALLQPVWTMTSTTQCGGGVAGRVRSRVD